MKLEKLKKLDNNIRQKVLFEINQVDKLINDAQPLLRFCIQKDPEFIEKSAAALLLHSFYNGIENIFNILLKHYGEIKISSDKWHRMVLESVFESTENRDNILDPIIKDKVIEYLAFRHFIRHAYGFQIDWKKMKHLIVELESIWDHIKEDIKLFLNE